MSTKISQLTSATDITASDLMQIVDVEDGVMAPSGTNKKVTASLLAKELAKQPLEPGIVISGSSSGDAVRITQTGAGSALVVEDSTNPDSTPFVVAGNGNVGIGTSSPQVPLDIANCGIRINASRQISSNADNGGLLVFGGTAGNGANIELYGGSDVNSPNMAYIDADVTHIRSADGASERMRITSAGNVGIGTNTPAGKLEVKGTGNNVVTLSGDSFVGLSFNSYRDSGSDHGMLIYHAARGTESSPAAVQNGDITASIVSRPYDGSTNVGTAAIRFLADGAVSSGVIPQEIRFHTGTTALGVLNRIAIKSDGDVGIGTDTPSSKLHVAGDLTMSSATVATSATAGTNGDVPAQVAGYLVVNINGTARKIPYYA
jgi:hypothetical protein